MKKMQIAAACFAVLGLVSCKNDVSKDTTEDASKTEVVKETETTKETDVVKDRSVYEASKQISFELFPKSGSKAGGKVVFAENEGIVYLTAEIGGLEEGTHAIHIHEKADCSSEDGKSTGGHWNPTFENHGKWGASEGFHKGDIGNFEANAKGSGFIEFATDQWCIGCGDEKKDIIGKAVVVHQGADDFTSQPSGAAGARISCAGIIE